MNWHEVKEKPVDSRICVIKVLNDVTKTIDYRLGNHRRLWTLAHTQKRIQEQILAWAYINEPVTKNNKPQSSENLQ